MKNSIIIVYTLLFCVVSHAQAQVEEHDSEEIAAIVSEMVSIPAGSFDMGDLSGDGDGHAKPVHRVTVPAFWLGKYEVTFAQWDACVRGGGCTLDVWDICVPDRVVASPDCTDFNEHPITHVSWDDAQTFIDWLNGRTGGNFRLPTEAEWEYAARAGTTTTYSWGDNIGRNCRGCGWGVHEHRDTAPVGSFPANAWGLHDMHGNVSEWVQDCWNYSYEGAPTDGSARTSGECSQRVLRGGSWGYEPWYLRSAFRGRGDLSSRYTFIGFRLARSEPVPALPDGETRAEVEDERGQAERTVKRLVEGMVSVPAGEFRMGSRDPEAEDNEKPAHRVTVPAFKLGKYEVTFAQWDACVADGGCNSYSPDDRGWGRGNRPVFIVSWDDVQSFIDWLNGKTGGNYRLPSEAEWEYAARAGSTTNYSWGDDIGNHLANCESWYCGDRWEHTAPVGSFPANAWGLHDMHGNVEEWVQDCWNDSYEGAPTDGSAWTSGGCDWRVVRGGSWDLHPWYLHSASRSGVDRSYRFYLIGFRLAQDE